MFLKVGKQTVYGVLLLQSIQMFIKKSDGKKTVWDHKLCVSVVCDGKAEGHSRDTRCFRVQNAVFIIWAELKHWTAVRQENQSINRQEAKSDKYKQKQEEYQDHCANHLFVCTVKIKKNNKIIKSVGCVCPQITNMETFVPKGGCVKWQPETTVKKVQLCLLHSQSPPSGKRWIIPHRNQQWTQKSPSSVCTLI